MRRASLATALLWLRRAPSAGTSLDLAPSAGGAAAVAFLLRDSRGGRARRWFALEARDEAGNPPGRWGSIRRNLPLLIPFWNLAEVWPLLPTEPPSGRPTGPRGIRIHAIE